MLLAFVVSMECTADGIATDEPAAASVVTVSSVSSSSSSSASSQCNCIVTAAAFRWSSRGAGFVVQAAVTTGDGVGGFDGIVVDGGDCRNRCDDGMFAVVAVLSLKQPSVSSSTKRP